MLLHLGPQRDKDSGIFSILAFGGCHATTGALDGVVHSAPCVIFRSVDGISTAVHDVVATLVVFVLLGGHRFPWNIAKLLDEADAAITRQLVRDGHARDFTGHKFCYRVPGPRPIAFTCGSGITACVLGLTNSIISGKKPVVYDGSWAEYGIK